MPSRRGTSQDNAEAPAHAEAMAARSDDGVSLGQGGQGENPDGSVRSEALTGVTATYYAWEPRYGPPRSPPGTTLPISNATTSTLGVERGPTRTKAGNTHWWTGHERDGNSATPGQTGLDYMHTRYDGSNLGRFMKPDTLLGKTSNPQTWNLYANVQNNPMGLQ